MQQFNKRESISVLLGSIQFHFEIAIGRNKEKVQCVVNVHFTGIKLERGKQ